MKNVHYGLTALIVMVQDHAVEHYEEGGWDVLVECYTVEQIAELIGKARTFPGALKKVGEALNTYNDYRNEIMATAF